MQKKRIIIFNNNGINFEIYKNLKSLNFDVYCYIKSDYKYTPTFIDRFLNIFFRIFLNDKYFIIRKEKKSSDFFYKNELKKQDNFDYSLLIRADKYDNSTLSIIQEKTKKMIGYQWDGMDRYPEIYNKLSFFDKFYCFDPKDCNSKIRFTTNFFFDYKKILESKIEYDLIYIGFFTQDRFDFLNEFQHITQNMKTLFLLRPQTKEEDNEFKNNALVKKLEKIYSYEEMMILNQKSKILLDLKVADHQGLSFRFFEAIQLNKLIITTNKDIINYDFYNKDYIYIWGIDKNINEFISSNKTVFYPTHIKEKYSFTSWIKDKIN